MDAYQTSLPLSSSLPSQQVSLKGPHIHLLPTLAPVEQQQLSGTGIFQREFKPIFNSMAQGW